MRFAVVIVLLHVCFQVQFLHILAGRTIFQVGNASSTCPLDFTVLQTLIKNSKRPAVDDTNVCRYILQGLRLVQSEYLRRTNFFLPPLDSADSCWQAYQSVVKEFAPNLDIRRSCGFETSWISEGCMNITTRDEFESNITQKGPLNYVVNSCNQSLLNGSPCAACTTAISGLQTYLRGPSIGNVSDCTVYPIIYAAAFANQLGPTDIGTSICLFSLNFTVSNSGNKHKKIVIGVIVGVTSLLFILLFSGYWFLWRKRRKLSKARLKLQLNSGSFQLDSITGSTHLMRFTLDEIKAATNNFSMDNFIGRGGYGNVFKGVLPDGSEVAIKRFKNCSAAAYATFTHEVEVIASVSHVNLVSLKGYCVATTPYEGHKRIIICDLIKNGSLDDNLFGLTHRKLSWPIRQKIALGMARGLSYLHYGVQPGIIHRDIKASNILLDEFFEAKVADFGLAKFTPEGMTHLSTKVAGTMGYVAPEYALYGQLSERSDVYSFGVVLLELLSGKKAIMSVNDNQPTLVTDWAWSLVRKGNAVDVVEVGMPDLGPYDVLEKYVLIGVLCSHPQLYARPTMDQVVKMLDTDIAVPSIPERPIPLTADIEDIDRAASSSGSGNLSTVAGYQPYRIEEDHNHTSCKEDDDDDDDDKPLGR